MLAAGCWCSSSPPRGAAARRRARPRPARRRRPPPPRRRAPRDDERQTTRATTSSSSSSGLSSIATAGNCKQLSDLSASFSKAITGVGENDFEKRAKLLKEFADKTPSDIRPDFEVLADAFAQVRVALKDIHLKPGKVPDAATLAKLQKLSTSIDQAAVTKASTNISAWAQKNCTKRLDA